MLRRRQFNKQLGLSMLEVLVSIFILATGLLGLASVEVLSIKNVNNAQFQTLATTYAYDMAERMRSNREGVDSGAYAGIDSDVSEPSCSSCSSSEMAQLDGYQWIQQIQSSIASGGLPSGQGAISQSGDVYDITISWDEQLHDADGGGVESTSFTLSVQI